MRKASAVQELRDEVVRLREDGLSFSKVAKRLGIVKSYAVKLSQQDGDRSAESVTGHSTALTVRQRRFMAGLAEGKTQREAAVEAGVPPGGADSFAQRSLNNEQFQECFKGLLDRVGLSEAQIAQVHSENLRATKVVATATRDGAITDILEVPDYPTRQRAVQAAWALLGRNRPPEPVEPPPPPFVLNITPRDAVLTEQLTGTAILDDQTRQRVLESEEFKNDPVSQGCWKGPSPSPSVDEDKGEAEPDPWDF